MNAQQELHDRCAMHHASLGVRRELSNRILGSPRSSDGLPRRFCPSAPLPAVKTEGRSRRLDAGMLTTVGSFHLPRSDGRPVVVQDHRGEEEASSTLTTTPQVKAARRASAGSGEGLKRVVRPMQRKHRMNAQPRRPLDRAENLLVHGGRDVGATDSVTTVMRMEAMKKPKTNFGKRSQMTPADLLARSVGAVALLPHGDGDDCQPGRPTADLKVCGRRPS